MKKRIFILLGVLFVGLVFFLILPSKKFVQKPESETQKEKLDLTTFEKFDQSHFGFMHPQESYSFVQELGVHFQRPHPGPFIWGDLEPERGHFDFEDVDEYVAESQKYDVAIMATIWPYADWDQKNCHSKLPNSPRRDFSLLGDYRQKPCDMSIYQSFVQTLVERYDGDGIEDMVGLKYPIKYWEVINEPEMQGDLLFFKGGEDSAEEYFEILKITYGAIKKADENAKVLNGGIAALSPQEKPFWQKLVDLGGAQYIDVLTFHSISGSENLDIPALLEFIQDNSLTMAFWLTEIQPGRQEFGLPARAGGLMDRPAPSSSDTQEDFASQIVRSFIYAFGEGATKLFYVGLDETSPGEENSWLINCQSPNRGCQKQAGFYSFQTMVSKIDYFDEAEKLAEGQYKFMVLDRPVYVLWSGSMPEEISGLIKVTNLKGQEKTLETKEAQIQFNQPIFIEKEESKN